MKKRSSASCLDEVPERRSRTGSVVGSIQAVRKRLFSLNLTSLRSKSGASSSRSGSPSPQYAGVRPLRMQGGISGSVLPYCILHEASDGIELKGSVDSTTGNLLFSKLGLTDKVCTKHMGEKEIAGMKNEYMDILERSGFHMVDSTSTFNPSTGGFEREYIFRKRNCEPDEADDQVFTSDAAGAFCLRLKSGSSLVGSNSSHCSSQTSSPSPSGGGILSRTRSCSHAHGFTQTSSHFSRSAGSFHSRSTTSPGCRGALSPSADANTPTDQKRPLLGQRRAISAGSLPKSAERSPVVKVSCAGEDDLWLMQN